MRQARLEYEIDGADAETERILQEIYDSPVEDLFQSEIDLVEEIPDEAVREQIKQKMTKN